MTLPKLATLRTAAELRARAATLGVDLAVDDTLEAGPDGPLARTLQVGSRRLGNRWAILPMEGWDGDADGRPSDLTRRRWRRFGESGAKLIFGGEAVAVREDGRANPHQVVLRDSNQGELASLREGLVSAHAEHHGVTDDLMIGLQLTHSGRWSRPGPSGRPAPRIAYRHPLLDARVGVVDDTPVFSDAELDDLVADFVRAAVLARAAGFDFVDLKHCHGYLGHELLSAVDRPGPYGGSFEGRTRFLRQIVAGIRRDAPGLDIAVRLSLFDRLPYQRGPDGVGVPVPWSGPYPYAFGAEPESPELIRWEEPFAFLSLVRDLGIRLVCLTAGSPYYNPHLQRPAMVPPSDGYLPPEDPLVGVARQLTAVATAKAAFPDLVMVGSAYSYLQDWLPYVAQAQVRSGRVDLVGLGRMVLSYPALPADVLTGRPLQRRLVCRTFSECTTGPRNGLVSGCFPLDDFYKQHPDAARLKALGK